MALDGRINAVEKVTDVTILCQNRQTYVSIDNTPNLWHNRVILIAELLEPRPQNASGANYTIGCGWCCPSLLDDPNMMMEVRSRPNCASPCECTKGGLPTAQICVRFSVSCIALALETHSIPLTLKHMTGGGRSNETHIVESAGYCCAHLECFGCITDGGNCPSAGASDPTR